MAKKWQKVTAGVLTGVLAASALAIAPGCGDTLVVNIDPVEGINYTYRTYTSVSPSNWNELTYEDNNDTQIMSYIQSPFMEFDYQFNDDETVKEDGTFKVKYSAATKLEDVTGEMAEDWGYTEQQVEDGGYAWRFTLRDDLMWDDGTPIYAQDFVYTMKQQLDPLFKNFRADSYYSGNYIFRNAKEYVYQGSVGLFDATMVYKEADYKADIDSKLVFQLSIVEDTGSTSLMAQELIGALGESVSGYGGDNEAFLDDLFYVLDAYSIIPKPEITDGMTDEEKADAVAARNAKVMALEGKTLAQIKADTEMNAIYEMILAGWSAAVGGAGNPIHLCVTDYEWPEVDFSDVGIFSQGTYELVIILDTPLGLIDDDGNLTYEAAYYMSSLPLVKQSLYESCKKAPVEGSTLWTSNYCSSLETTASWGPYKLVKFQAGRYYELRRNPNWYGYKDYDEDGKSDLYPGQYQTERIVCDTVKSWNTAWQMFQKGGIDGIGIDVTIADDYKDSSRAYFTPDDFIQSMHLQSQSAALKNYKVPGVDDGDDTNGDETATSNRDNRLLANVKFRQAVSLAIDRDDYAATCTTSSLKGLGYFNTMHYYDVANGGMYRNTEVAKEALLRTYGFVEDTEGKWSINNGPKMDIDAAIESMTGYNVDLARTLVNQAIAEEIAASNWEANAVLTLVWGTSIDSESTRRHYNYIKKALTDMFVGTNLEGKFELIFDGSYGDKWHDDFVAGKYDICTGGWTGGAWNPYYFIGAYIMDGTRYADGWKPSSLVFEFTFPTAEGDVTKKYNASEWYDILNGATNAPYNGTTWPTETRLALVAKLEEEILQTYWSIPTINSFAASLMTHKCDYISYEYNQFMGYGGIQYMTYHYTDAEWKAYVAQQGTLNYKG